MNKLKSNYLIQKDISLTRICDIFWSEIQEALKSGATCIWVKAVSTKYNIHPITMRLYLKHFSKFGYLKWNDQYSSFFITKKTKDLKYYEIRRIFKEYPSEWAKE